MKIKRVVTLCFSPTGNTKKVCEAIASSFAGEKETLDRTDFEERWKKDVLTSEDLVIIGMPVYYGRVPRLTAELFRGLEINQAKAVYVVTYGNRDFEDALLELKNVCEKRGFQSVAAGAFVGEHSYTEKLGTGRPNQDDLAKAEEFGKEINKLLEQRESLNGASLEVKGSMPYVPAPDLPTSPATDERCTGCGLCIKICPVHAINPGDPKEIDGWRCLSCARCVKSCPQKAKAFCIPAMAEKVIIMENMFTQPKENDLFFISQ